MSTLKTSLVWLGMGVMGSAISPVPVGHLAPLHRPSSVRAMASPRSPSAFAAFEAAYRADMADMDHPVSMGLEEAQILADMLGIGVQIFQVVPELPVSSDCLKIESLAIINWHQMARNPMYSILAFKRQFSIVAPREEDEVAEYVHGQPGVGVDYIEAGLEEDDSVRLVDDTGHGLIEALYFIRSECFPSKARIALLRSAVATRLSVAQINNALLELEKDLIVNAAARPWEHGRFSSWGPRVSALLAAEPSFMAARERALAPHRHLQAPLASSASDGAVAMTDVEPCLPPQALVEAEHPAAAAAPSSSGSTGGSKRKRSHRRMPCSPEAPRNGQHRG